VDRCAHGRHQLHLALGGLGDETNDAVHRRSHANELVAREHWKRDVTVDVVEYDAESRHVLGGGVAHQGRGFAQVRVKETEAREHVFWTREKNSASE